MACNNEKEIIKTSVGEERLPLIEFDFSKIDEFCYQSVK